MDLSQFIAWQAAEPGRSIDISIRHFSYPKENQQEIRVWAYDTNLMEGQYVQDVNEIDLVAVKEAKERAKLAELQKKYGG